MNIYIYRYEQWKLITNNPLASLLMGLTELCTAPKQKINLSADQPSLSLNALSFFEPSNLWGNNANLLELINKLKRNRMIFLECCLDKDDYLKSIHENIKDFLVKENLSTQKDLHTFLQYIIEDADIKVWADQQIDSKRKNFTPREKTGVKKNLAPLQFDFSHSQSEETVSVDISEQLQTKNLAKNLFDSEPNLTLQSELSVHIKWAFEHIYSVNYRGHENKTITRLYHGIQHVTRTAIYVPVFANLYRRHGDVDAQKLIEEDIKLLQLAAIVHDSAREDEGADRWDIQSASFLYLYLVQKLKVHETRAKLFAEAIANKDPLPNGYLALDNFKEGKVTWKFQTPLGKKNIYQKLMQNVDCLDILRARDHFNARYLDFYLQYHSDKLAVEEMAHLITEVRSLIEIQGDSRNAIKIDVKCRYEHADAYTLIVQSLDKKLHKILMSLGQLNDENNKLIPLEILSKMQLVDVTLFDSKLDLTETNIAAALREGKLFARSISIPSAQFHKDSKNKKNKNKNKTESLAEIELRKVFRDPETPTTTSKMNKLGKEGNTFRSASMLGYGAGVLSEAGFFIINSISENIVEISETDSDSGHFKKKALQKNIPAIFMNEKHIQLDGLRLNLKLGGNSKRHKDYPKEFVSKHNEIILRCIKEYSAVYFCKDPNLYNYIENGIPEIRHKFSPILQAVYLRNEYEIRSHQKIKLPLFEYSGLHNLIRLVPEDEISDEKLIMMWVEMCSDFIKEHLMTENKHFSIYTISLNNLKALSMYKSKVSLHVSGLFYDIEPADSNYPSDLKIKIDAGIEAAKEKLIQEYEKKITYIIQAEKSSVFSDAVFFDLLHNPQLAKLLRDEIETEINLYLKSPNLDDFNVGLVTYKDKYDDNEIYIKINNHTDKFNDLKIIYAKKLVRIYELAKLIKSTETLKKIRYQLLLALNKYYQTEIAALTLTSSNPEFEISACYDYSYLICQYIYFANFFEIAIDETMRRHLEETFNFLTTLLTNIINNYFTCQNSTYRVINLYAQAVESFSSANELSPKNKYSIQDVVNKISAQLSKVNLAWEDFFTYKVTCHLRICPVSSYLKLAQLSGFDSAKVRHFYLQYIQTYKLGEVNGLFNLEINTSIVNLTELDAFNIIINSLNRNMKMSEFGDNSIVMGEWVKMIVKLKEKFNNNALFNHGQMIILQSKVASLFKELLSELDQTDPITKVFKLITDLKKFMSISKTIGLKVPEFVVNYLSNCFENFSLSDPTVLETLKTNFLVKDPSRFVNKIEFVHQCLLQEGLKINLEKLGSYNLASKMSGFSNAN